MSRTTLGQQDEGCRLLQASPGSPFVVVWSPASSTPRPGNEKKDAEGEERRDRAGSRGDHRGRRPLHRGGAADDRSLATERVRPACVTLDRRCWRRRRRCEGILHRPHRTGLPRRASHARCTSRARIWRPDTNRTIVTASAVAPTLGLTCTSEGPLREESPMAR